MFLVILSLVVSLTTFSHGHWYGELTLKSNRVRNFPFWELINIAQTRHLTCGIGGTVRSFFGLVGVKEDRSKLQARGLSNLLTIVAAALILITASHNSHAQSLVGIATSAADNTAVSSRGTIQVPQTPGLGFAVKADLIDRLTSRKKEWRPKAISTT